MSISSWPEAERPREKLRLKGASALSDAELLAIFLRTGTSGSTAVDIARELLIEFDGLRSLVNSDERQFCNKKGLGPAKYVQIQAAIELGRRYLESGLQNSDVLTNTQATRNYLLSKLCAYSHEVFACLFLDNRHRIIVFEELFRGTIDGASVYPREVVKRALQHNAAALIFAHNHPSGIAEPSEADRHITKKLKQALEIVDIRVLDHVVIGDNYAVSMAELGMI